MSAADRALRRLARDSGVQLSYRDVRGRLRRANSDALVAVLRALGAPLASPSDAIPLVERREQRPVLPPVIVAWDGKLPDIGCSGSLRADDGTEHIYSSAASLPLGYYELEVEGGRARVIAAPRRASILGHRRPRSRTWGVFLPLYALHSQRSQGVGDFTDLEALLRWTKKLGGSIVGTLPVYATFLDGSSRSDPSPYAPVSRLFWSELYVDPERTPEFERSRAAQQLVASSGFREAVERLRAGRHVDHVRVYALKRSILEHLAADADEARLRTFVASEPLAMRYASFRAALECGSDASARARAERFHTYAQLVAHEQLAAVAGVEARGGLQLDLPVGVHREGFDTEAFADDFAFGVSLGAPPDDFFDGGQNWGTPPLHPERSRQGGHAYFSAVIAKAMRTASVLRVDHILGLHRQYWVPDGMPADEGVYVTQPTDELYAIVALEAHRNRTTVVGEDLGTVPRGVRTTMRRRGVLSTWVLQFETKDDPDAPVSPPRADVLACVNTHDTEPFATFWDGLGEARRAALAAFLDAADPDAASALVAALRYLANGPAPILLVNVEDLLGEREPQNVPGTTQQQRPNWSRRAELPFEDIASERFVLDALAAVAAERTSSKDVA